MIGRVRGKISHRLPGSVLIEAGPVDLEVKLPLPDLEAAKIGTEASYYIYEQIKEDAHNLFGFAKLADKELFTQLLSVSGVGPKSALGVLSAASSDKIRQAVASGSAELFAGMAGVGKKTAERIVVELKGKLAADSDSLPATETYQALVGLGYSASQAAQAAAKVPADITDEQERIKVALRSLAK